ncbi:DUF2218 domain-containing protein [Loktanella salsilacus]|uniref:DUF2218 domain-containing protein n=1 Tax=Loktanella salsilacus TaxID=195913 RepID=UPI0030F92AE3
MPSSTATISTTRASGYLQQLCKHFAHKVPVTFTPQAGQITLPFGTSTLQAQDDTLTLTVTGEADALARLEQVIGDHLARLAFRENLSLTWKHAA